jgi:hypothetical protein
VHLVHFFVLGVLRSIQCLDLVLGFLGLLDRVLERHNLVVRRHEQLGQQACRQVTTGQALLLEQLGEVGAQWCANWCCNGTRELVEQWVLLSLALGLLESFRDIGLLKKAMDQFLD